MSSLVARLRAPLAQRTDFGDLLVDGWQTADAADLAARFLHVEGSGPVPMGALFDISHDESSDAGEASLRLIGDLRHADRLGAGLRSGEVIVEGCVGEQLGARMRRGVIVVTGDTGARPGVGMIAGSIVIFGNTGAEAGLWSKRGSIVSFSDSRPSPTYRYACTYQPPHLRLLLTRLRARFRLPVKTEYVNGLYDRYSGDFAELGKGEMLVWRPT